ncbi:MAG: endonuclease/exonuclease/phosphatase family protein [Armatimonadetes bacterium]|nr:endonuclease/exonuclease/phosphatase family protein [Armatimonadota bacterium]
MSLLLSLGICLHLAGANFGLMVGSGGKKLRVMSWNLHHGEFGLPGIVATIKAENPDVILLQEIHEVHGPLRPIEGLFELLPEYRMTGNKESAILTKIPIESGKVHELNLNSDRRYIPEVKLRFDGQLLTFYTTHLYNGFRPVWVRTPGSLIYWSKKAQEDREDQIRELDIVVSKGGYTILGGDFNTIPKGGVYDHFASRFGDSFKHVGRGVGWTFPANFPVVRIDYLWTTPDILTAEFRVVKSSASDHLPIVAEFVMKK